MKNRKTFSDEQLHDLHLRYQAAFDMNQRFINQIIKAVKLVSPLSDGLNVLYGYNDTGKDLNINIHNSTPKWCSNARANKLHSLLLPINRKWGSVYSSDAKTGESIYEEEYTNKIFDVIDKSNLHSIAKSFFLDLNIGCGAIWIDSPSKDKPVSFKNISGITLMPEYSDDPYSTNVWFKKVINWRDLNIINPSIAQDKDKNKEYNITCGYLNMTNKYGKYCYIQFLDDNFSEPISTHWSPWRQLILVNETLRAGEARGHGIILQILEDIEYLNDITGKLKGYIKYAANPDLLVGDNMPYSFGSGGGGNIFPTELVADGRMPVQPIEWQLNIQAVEGMIQTLEQKIRQFFNVMPLGMPENTPHATATEVGYRQADEERQSIADLARVANETLGGLMRSIFDILKHRGIIDVKDSHYEFKFDSPAVDIQAQDDLNSILQLSEMSTQILGQGASNVYMDQQATFTALAKNLKVTNSILNSPDKVKAITDKINQQAEQSQTQQQDQSMQPQAPSPADPVNPTQLGQSTNVAGVGF